MRRGKHAFVQILIVLALLVSMTGVMMSAASAVPANVAGNVSFSQVTPNACTPKWEGPGRGPDEACVNVSLASSDPDIVDRMAEGTTVQFEKGSRVAVSGEPNSLQLPTVANLTDSIEFGTYTVTIDAGEEFEPYTGTFEVNEQDPPILFVVLQVAEDEDSDDLVQRLIQVLIEILRQIL